MTDFTATFGRLLNNPPLIFLARDFACFNAFDLEIIGLTYNDMFDDFDSSLSLDSRSSESNASPSTNVKLLYCFAVRCKPDMKPDVVKIITPPYPISLHISICFIRISFSRLCPLLYALHSTTRKSLCNGPWCSATTSI